MYFTTTKNLKNKLMYYALACVYIGISGQSINSTCVFFIAYLFYFNVFIISELSMKKLNIV